MKKSQKQFVVYSVLIAVLLLSTFAIVWRGSPAPYLYSNATNHSLTFRFNYTGTIGTRINCSVYIDGVESGYNRSPNSGKNSTILMNLISGGGLTNGTHVWNVSCINASGNRQTTNLTRLVIDRFASTVSATSLANGLNSTSTSKTFNWNVTDRGTKTVKLNCSVMINTIGTNRTNIKVTNNSGIGNYTSGYTNGHYRWNISCIDNATNRGVSAVRLFTVDTNVPVFKQFRNTTSATSGGKLINEDASGTVSVPVNDTMTGMNRTHCKLYVDGTLNSTMTFNPGAKATGSALGTANRSIAFKNPGNHTFTANCTDVVGNYATKSVTFEINDTQKPSIISTSAIPAALSAVLSITTDDRVNFTLYYQKDAAITTANPGIRVVVATAKSNNHSYTLGGLTESSTYYYNITVCDKGTRCNMTKGTFTTTSNSGGRHRTTTPPPTTIPVVVEPVITPITTAIPVVTATTPITEPTTGAAAGAAGAGQAGVTAPTTTKEAAKPAVPTVQKLSFWAWIKAIIARVFGVFS